MAGGSFSPEAPSNPNTLAKIQHISNVYQFSATSPDNGVAAVSRQTA